MGAGEDILKQLAKQEIMLARLCAHLGIDRSPTNGGNSGNGNGGANQDGGAGGVAPLAAIQGDRGDPEVKGKPRDWSGPPFDGSKMSQCPPDFLDVFADFLDWKADNPRPGKEKYARYDRDNAGRARRWAVELRAGRVKPAAQDEALPPAPGDDSGGNQWDSGGDLPPPPFDDSVPF